jgi:hypothetical protein
MENKKSGRTAFNMEGKAMTLKQRTARHRAAHPRDKISFGEKPVSKPKKAVKSAVKVEDTPPKKTAGEAKNATKITEAALQSRQNESPSTMIRCVKCGTVANRHRVRIGDCHTERYGKGDYGQTYSGGKGRGRLHGI